MRLPPCAAAIALSLICVCAPASELGHLSKEPRVSEARRLIESGDFHDALSVLRKLDRNHEDITDIRFLTGLAAIRHSQVPGTGEADRSRLLDEAVGALRLILDDRPELFRVRLELAYALFLKGSDKAAQRHFELVLAGRPSPQVAANIARFIGAMRERRRWRGYFGFSLIEDTNINRVTAERVVTLFGLPFRLTERTVRSGAGAVFRGGGEYRAPLTEAARLRTGFDVSRREHGGREFDAMSLSVHAGPQWSVADGFELSVLAGAHRYWHGSRTYSRSVGLRVESEHRVRRNLKLLGRMSWFEREVVGDRLLKGPLWSLSAGVEWLPNPTVRSTVSVAFERERPESVFWRNSTVRLGAEVSKLLAHGVTLGVSGQAAATRFIGGWGGHTPGGAPRRDDYRSAGITLRKRDLALFEFVPQLSLTRERRSSNAPLFSYVRNYAEVSMVRRY